MPVDINESIKVRNGETAMEGKWKVYDSHSGKTIKEVGSPRAATRLMNRLMSSGQYKEITTKWVGETVNEADDHELEMAHGQLERSIEYSQMILKKLQDGGYDELPGWVQGKLTKSMDYLQSVFNYYDGKDGLDDKFQEYGASTVGYSPAYQTPDSYKKSTKAAINWDDEDDDDEILGGLLDKRKKRVKRFGEKKRKK